ncbi:hypothetical protein Taro_049914 [Colocasia esculenta]|uniref:Uncharacterized protein n=1 Tax=Colocasia esculenta TaxID=4460 RepID=A0A843XC17_COLES|nr:hypothetical protein [Colocasia esculenta]
MCPIPHRITKLSASACIESHQHVISFILHHAVPPGRLDYYARYQRSCRHFDSRAPSWRSSPSVPIRIRGHTWQPIQVCHVLGVTSQLSPNSLDRSEDPWLKSLLCSQLEEEFLLHSLPLRLALPDHMVGLIEPTAWARSTLDSLPVNAAAGVGELLRGFPGVFRHGSLRFGVFSLRGVRVKQGKRRGIVGLCVLRRAVLDHVAAVLDHAAVVLDQRLPVQGHAAAVLDQRLQQCSFCSSVVSFLSCTSLPQGMPQALEVEMADRRDWGGGGEDPEESTQRMIERIWESLTDIRMRMDQQAPVPPATVPPVAGVPVAPVAPPSRVEHPGFSACERGSGGRRVLNATTVPVAFLLPLGNCGRLHVRRVSRAWRPADVSFVKATPRTGELLRGFPGVFRRGSLRFGVFSLRGVRVKRGKRRGIVGLCVLSGGSTTPTVVTCLVGCPRFFVSQAVSSGFVPLGEFPTEPVTSEAHPYSPQARARRRFRYRLPVQGHAAAELDQRLQQCSFRSSVVSFLSCTSLPRAMADKSKLSTTQKTAQGKNTSIVEMATQRSIPDRAKAHTLGLKTNEVIEDLYKTMQDQLALVENLLLKVETIRTNTARRVAEVDKKAMEAEEAHVTTKVQITTLAEEEHAKDIAEYCKLGDDVEDEDIEEADAKDEGMAEAIDGGLATAIKEGLEATIKVIIANKLVAPDTEETQVGTEDVVVA